MSVDVEDSLACVAVYCAGRRVVAGGLGGYLHHLDILVPVSDPRRAVPPPLPANLASTLRAGPPAPSRAPPVLPQGSRHPGAAEKRTIDVGCEGCGARYRIQVEASREYTVTFQCKRCPSRLIIDVKAEQ